MASDEVMERVRELRREGCSPKQIARALHLPPAQVVPLVRAIAAEADAGEDSPASASAPAHLGEWQDPSMISFGYQGKPLFIAGPQDDAARIMKRLQRKVGRGGHHHIAPV